MNAAPGVDRFLSPDVPARRVVARIGLISDTHWPARSAAPPPALFDALRGVDLILHAGDVGELRLLDQLSAIAPVVAVHGNDETDEARRELPYRLIVGAGGVRILLTHAHFTDRAEEMASRRDDAWGPKLDRRVAMGHQAGARIVVFGHTHIPMAVERDGILLVNPGAFACPNLTSRQAIMTAAVLFIHEDGAPVVTHIDLARPDRPFVPRIDWGAGFLAAHRQFSVPILTPDLAPRFALLSETIERVAPETGWVPYLRLAHRCWSGAQEIITRDELRDAYRDTAEIPPAAKIEIAAVLGES